MGIKVDHQHGKMKTCFVTRSHYSLTKGGLFNLGGRSVTGAYMAYTGCWYFWDPETGTELAQIRGRFYDSQAREMVDLDPMVEAMRTSTLMPDPDCLIVG